MTFQPRPHSNTPDISVHRFNPRNEAMLIPCSGQTKPVFHKKAKTTKKIVLRLECNVCKQKSQLPIKRCKHFELGLVHCVMGDPWLTTMAAATRRRRARLLCSDGLFRRALIHWGHGRRGFICTACIAGTMGRNKDD